MKKVFVLIASVICLNMNAQWQTTGSDIYYSSGKVGIGIAPSSLFHVYNGKSNASYSSWNKALIESNGHTQVDILAGPSKEAAIYLKATYSAGTQTFGGVGYFMQNTSTYGLDFYSGNSVRMRILDNGKVGINTVTPRCLFHVYQGTSSALSSTFQSVAIESNNHSQIDILSGQNKESAIYLKTTNSSGSQTFGGVGYYTQNTTTYGLDFYSGNAVRMRILENGRIGIGTLTPDFDLDVVGTIRAHHIKVNLDKAADFVFAPEYKLPILSEVESFVKENRHLPGVPSAEEFKKNGMDVSEMNNMLLQKVEEMTLLLIEQNKRIEQLEKEVGKN